MNLSKKIAAMASKIARNGYTDAAIIMERGYEENLVSYIHFRTFVSTGASLDELNVFTGTITRVMQEFMPGWEPDSNITVSASGRDIILGYDFEAFEWQDGGLTLEQATAILNKHRIKIRQ